MTNKLIIKEKTRKKIYLRANENNNINNNSVMKRKQHNKKRIQ